MGISLWTVYGVLGTDIAILANSEGLLFLIGLLYFKPRRTSS
jgi:hypothetical protein